VRSDVNLFIEIAPLGKGNRQASIGKQPPDISAREYPSCSDDSAARVKLKGVKGLKGRNP